MSTHPIRCNCCCSGNIGRPEVGIIRHFHQTISKSSMKTLFIIYTHANPDENISARKKNSFASQFSLNLVSPSKTDSKHMGRYIYSNSITKSANLLIMLRRGGKRCVTSHAPHKLAWPQMLDVVLIPHFSNKTACEVITLFLVTNN